MLSGNGIRKRQRGGTKGVNEHGFPPRGFPPSEGVAVIVTVIIVTRCAFVARRPRRYGAGAARAKDETGSKGCLTSATTL